MNILVYKGGLGNQIFQMVFFLFLKQNKINVRFDLEIYNNSDEDGYTSRTFELNNLFNVNFKDYRHTIINSSKISRYRSKKTIKNIIISDFNFQINHVYNRCTFDGYWQDEMFFNNLSKENKINLIPKISEKTKIILQNEINFESRVAIHIRRGDYVSNSEISKVHCCCNIDYYEKAIQLIEDNIFNPTFIIFTDDIPWVKSNLKINSPNFLVSDKFNLYDWEELSLFSQCDHFIISNSTFSWWGARLGSERGMKIAPYKWFINEEINESYIKKMLSQFTVIAN